MRGAGCTYNDILDRDIDAKVERTRLRPIPSGAVSLKAAWAWLFLQCLVGLAALLVFPRLAQIVALIALPLVALYPLMKRITWWPQAWLGVVFSWGALVGGAAVAVSRWRAAARRSRLYVGCMMWTIGLRHDLRAAGPRGRRADRRALYCAACSPRNGERGRACSTCWRSSLWGVAAALAGAPLDRLSRRSRLIGALLIWPMLQSVDDATSGYRRSAAFKRNALIGAAVLIAFALEPIWRTLRPLLGD